MRGVELMGSVEAMAPSLQATTQQVFYKAMYTIQGAGAEILLDFLFIQPYRPLV